MYILIDAYIQQINIYVQYQHIQPYYYIILLLNSYYKSYNWYEKDLIQFPFPICMLIQVFIFVLLDLLS